MMMNGLMPSTIKDFYLAGCKVRITWTELITPGELREHLRLWDFTHQAQLQKKKKAYLKAPT